MDHWNLESSLAALSHLDLADQIVEKQELAAEYGGHCDVYRAWSKQHNKNVAVKQIRSSLRKEPLFAKVNSALLSVVDEKLTYELSDIAGILRDRLPDLSPPRLVKEIRIWAKLDHQNVLPLLGFFTEGENMAPSMVSEWMEDGTMLSYVIRKKFPCGGTECREMLRGVASGLAYLHSKQVIHADLKTHNILVSPLGVPLLADFGLSRTLSQSQSTSATTSTKGTVRWMAMELLQPNEAGDPVKHDEKSDVWAFGMVVYELLSGNVPFHKFDNNIHVVITISRGGLPEKPEEGPEPITFNHLWEIARSCWKPTASLRPTAQQLADRLAAEIEGIPGSPVDDESYVRRRLWRKVINTCIAVHRMQVWTQHEPSDPRERDEVRSETLRRLWRKAVNTIIAVQRWSRRDQLEDLESGKSVAVTTQRRLWHKAVNACIAIYRMKTWSALSQSVREQQEGNS